MLGRESDVYRAGLRRAHPSPTISILHHPGLPGQLSALGQGCTGTYGSHSSFRQRLPKPGLFRRTSASAASRSLPGWSILDKVRGVTQWAHDWDRGTKQPTCDPTNVLLSGYYMPGLYTGHRMLYGVVIGLLGRGQPPKTHPMMAYHTCAP